MKIHPSDTLLEELSLSLQTEHRPILEHLVGCEECYRRFRALRSRQPGSLEKRVGTAMGFPGTPTEYDEALARVRPEVETHRRALSQERMLAPGLFVELTSHPSKEWDRLIEKDARFHTWGVFELLVERSLETATRDSIYAEELGLVALRLSAHLDIERYKLGLIEDLRGRAWAQVGNARRLRSDLRGAEDAFTIAEVHLRAGSQDPMEQARLLDLKASLRRDQRRFEEALRLLRRARVIFLRAGDSHRAGRVQVNMSTVLHYAGRPEEGLPLLHQALGLIDAEKEPRLLLCARHNLIDYTASAGRFLEAQALYRETRPLYRDFPDAWAQNRRKWVRAKIARGLGQERLAESLFLTARDGFVAEGIPYDTALVSLEIATLYAEQGRTADLRRLAEEMIPIFSSLQIHREALAALAFLRQAIEAEKATVELVSKIADYLRRAQHDPALPFQAL